MVPNNKKIIKFHASEVENIVIRYATRVHDTPNGFLIEEFDALKDPELCETVNVQVVADFVTITFYKQEKGEFHPTQRIDTFTYDRTHLG